MSSTDLPDDGRVKRLVAAIKPDLKTWCVFELGDEGIFLCWEICGGESEGASVKIGTIPDLRGCIEEHYMQGIDFSDRVLEDTFHELLSLITCRIYE